MQAGEPGNAVQKRHDGGMLIPLLLVCPPSLQGTAGHVKHLGRLTLGHPLGGERAIAFNLLRPFEAFPALLASRIAPLWVLDDCSHRYLLLRSLTCAYVMAKDGEIAGWFQPSVGIKSLMV
jgi:hypothetical protein